MPPNSKDSYDICPVCFWEDDAIAYKYPDESISSNGVSLNEARENYIKFKACHKDMIPYVREPEKDELSGNE